MIISSFLFIFGHIFAALAVYFNHRFVFHGNLGKLPVLRRLKRLHSFHHAHAYDDKRNNFFEPAWAIVLLSAVILAISILNLPLGLGIWSFGILYLIRHRAIHNKDFSSKFSIHHQLHHLKHPRKNFSGIYPFIDTIFGTRVKQIASTALVSIDS